ncbi:MAG: hypothetical protein ACRDUY_06580, partial [Nitriliruptorales bacterium]
MKNLKRLTLLMSILAILGATLAAPAAAQTAAVFVFRGLATTSPLFVPDPQNLAPGDGDYTFDTSNALPDQFCVDVGVVNGAPTGDPQTGCVLHSDGGLYANVIGVGPSCGMSRGDELHSNGTIGSSTFTSSNLSPSFSSTDFGWITSAGGTIPFTATSADGDLVALVQAQGGADCVEVGTTKFAVIGVGALVIGVRSHLDVLRRVVRESLPFLLWAGLVSTMAG